MKPPSAFVIAALVSFCALPAVGQDSKTARIGYLTAHSAEAFNGPVFRSAMRDLGWVEGRNLIIDFRSAEGKAERLPALAAELVAVKVHAIVAAPTVPALAAKAASQTVPIVFTHVSDPVGSGLVSNLARPGGNVTGFTHLNAGLNPKRLELLKQLVPKATAVTALSHTGGLGASTEQEMLSLTMQAARALGLEVRLLPVKGIHEIEKAFATLASQPGRPMLVLPSPLFRNDPQLIVDLAARHRIPTMYFDREFAEAGGLVAYGADMASVVRAAAAYVDKILRGTKPGDLPVAQATKFELLINVKTADTLGIALPAAMSIQADQLIR